MTEQNVKNLRDAERASLYYNTDDGLTYRRTSAKGEFTFSGLKNGGRVSTITINSATWTKIPAIPLDGRNAISIQNYSGVEIKINYSDLIGGYVGIVIPDKGERYYDITDAIEIFAKCESGTASLTIEELS